MSVAKLAYLYAGWVREKPGRELLTALGIAIGVALVFATLTANQSIFNASARITDALTGQAQLQATARDLTGIPAPNLGKLPGVKVATGLLQVPVEIRGRHRVSTQLVGISPATLELNPAAANLAGGLTLPVALARAIGVHARETVTVFTDGRAARATVAAVLGRETVGPLSNSLLGLGPLPYVQRLAGLEGRVSTILAAVKPGQQRTARRSLEARFSPAMRVSATVNERAMLRIALRPQDESTSFFVLLGALVGALLVGTATMLTASDRRSELAALRLQGFSPRQLALIVLSQAVVLGAVASVAGVAVGILLAGAYAGSPDYLASAFALGAGTTISWPLAVAVAAAGVLVTSVCVGWVLVDLRGLRENAIPGARAVSGTIRGVSLAAAVLLAGLSILAEQTSSLLAALLLAVVVVLAAPSLLQLIVRVAERAAAVRSLKGIAVAAGAIRAAELRAVALAITAGVGVFGALVAVDVHHDLLHGLEAGYARYVQSADVWVTSPGDDLATRPVPASAAAKIRQVPGVRAVRPYYGGWLDMGGRRVWLISRSAAALPVGQVVAGDRAAANRRLAGSGAIAVSDQLAAAMHLRLGQRASIDTPAGIRSFTLVATTTNLGWSSGLVFLSPVDYKRDWAGTPTAFEVDATPTAIPGIRAAVGPGLDVQSSGQRAAVADALPRQGLQRLSQIAWLLVAAVAVAVACALSAAIWQRRSELASLRLQSFKPRTLQRMLAWEALLVIGAGVIAGLAAGSYGHLAADRYLKGVTGYPVAQAADLPGTVLVAVLMVAVATVIVAAPGYKAARAPLRLALDGR